KLTAPSRLYWAGRPAMRVVQSLHWLKDTLATDRDRILSRVSDILVDSTYGAAITEDLKAGLKTLPTWMQPVVRELLNVPVSGNRVARPKGAIADRKGHVRVRKRRVGDTKSKASVHRKRRGTR